MPRRYFVLALALAVAAGCIRLGFWQLDRLAQRRSRNAQELSRLTLPVLDVSDGANTPEPFRRIRATGMLDFSREVALTARTHDGSPGVYLVTPLARAGTDSLLLVVRGWVYSPDAATVDFVRWREPAAVAVEGFALRFAPDSAKPDSSTRMARAVRRLDHARLQQRLGAPVAGYYVILTSAPLAPDSAPVRLGPPALDEGPHFSYALQWFLFATIFGAGGAFVVLRAREAHPVEGRS